MKYLEIKACEKKLHFFRWIWLLPGDWGRLLAVLPSVPAAASPQGEEMVMAGDDDRLELLEIDFKT